VDIFSVTGIAGLSFLSARAVFVFCVVYGGGFFFFLKWNFRPAPDQVIFNFVFSLLYRRTKNTKRKSKQNKSFPVINSTGSNNNKASIYSGGGVDLLQLVSRTDSLFHLWW